MLASNWIVKKKKSDALSEGGNDIIPAGGSVMIERQSWRSSSSGLMRIVTTVRNVLSLELLLLCTAIAPVLIASIGFFVGKTVSPAYFKLSVVLMCVFALMLGWRKSFAYIFIIVCSLFLTAFTFAYTSMDGVDTQTYHFPLQYLLSHGWNPIFDSTLEKLKEFSATVGDGGSLAYHHTLFLLKFSELCGAVVAKSCGFFVGSGFLGWILFFALFMCAYRFSRRFWLANKFWAIAFAAISVFSVVTANFLLGAVDYSVYASFCIMVLTLVLYINENRAGDLWVSIAAALICLTSKLNGAMVCVISYLLMLPLVCRRGLYWRGVLLLTFLAIVIGASPLLTSWIHYGSPVYPAMTFNPSVKVLDITHDFSGNADALSMGYLSRICYAWLSPKLTVCVLRLWHGNPSFSPVFTVSGGVAGIGLWFNLLLILSVVLLLFSKKNLATYLCIVVFISANAAPLKYIGYTRYFSQIWLIVPLAIMNFVYFPQRIIPGQYSQKIINGFLALILVGLAGVAFLRAYAMQGRMMVQESYRQMLIAELAQERTEVRVNNKNYLFTNVVRFRQAGLKLVKSGNGEVDTVMHLASAFPCFDKRPELYDDVNKRFPKCNGLRSLFSYKWFAVFSHVPHVLWDCY